VNSSRRNADSLEGRSARDGSGEPLDARKDDRPDEGGRIGGGAAAGGTSGGNPAEGGAASGGTAGGGTAGGGTNGAGVP